MNRLKQLREDHKITHKKMAELLNIGIAAINRYESGRREIPHSILILYASIFNVSTDYILGLDDVPRRY